jgi:hypothetical protein
MKILLIMMLALCLLSENARAMPEPDTRKKMGTVHSGDTINSRAPDTEGKNASSGMVAVIQNATLPGYTNVKIGEALEKYKYFNKKEWRETHTPNGKIYVDFIGYFPSRWFDFRAIKEKIAARGIEIKFLIYPDGQYGIAMMSKVEIDSAGKMKKYPLEEVKSIMDAIYENKNCEGRMEKGGK